MLKVSYLPGVPEVFQRSFQIQIAHLDPENITLTGEGIFPRICLDLPRNLKGTSAALLFPHWMTRCASAADDNVDGNMRYLFGVIPSSFLCYSSVAWNIELKLTWCLEMSETGCGPGWSQIRTLGHLAIIKLLIKGSGNYTSKNLFLLCRVPSSYNLALSCHSQIAIEKKAGLTARSTGLKNKLYR